MQAKLLLSTHQHEAALRALQKLNLFSVAWIIQACILLNSPQIAQLNCHVRYTLQAIGLLSNYSRGGPLVHVFVWVGSSGGRGTNDKLPLTLVYA